MSDSPLIIYAKLQELQALPEEDCYLYHNFPWKPHAGAENLMELRFDEEDPTEAYGVFHELWKIRFLLPSLRRNWN